MSVLKAKGWWMELDGEKNWRRMVRALMGRINGEEKKWRRKVKRFDEEN